MQQEDLFDEEQFLEPPSQPPDKSPVTKILISQVGQLSGLVKRLINEVDASKNKNLQSESISGHAMSPARATQSEVIRPLSPSNSKVDELTVPDWSRLSVQEKEKVTSFELNFVSWILKLLEDEAKLETIRKYLTARRFYLKAVKRLKDSEKAKEVFHEADADDRLLTARIDALCQDQMRDLEIEKIKSLQKQRYTAQPSTSQQQQLVPSGNLNPQIRSRPGPDRPCALCGASDHWFNSCPHANEPAFAERARQILAHRAVKVQSFQLNQGAPQAPIGGANSEIRVDQSSANVNGNNGDGRRNN